MSNTIMSSLCLSRPKASNILLIIILVKSKTCNVKGSMKRFREYKLILLLGDVNDIRSLFQIIKFISYLVHRHASIATPY